MSVTPPVYLGPILAALIVAISVALLIRKLNMPYTISLVIAGLMLGLFSQYQHQYDFSLEGILSAEVILFLILPPLLFDGASKLDWGSFKRIWRITTILAIPGVIINMFVIGVIVWYLVWDGNPDMMLFALLLGAILAPTDPVSVLALFKECGAPHRLSTMVESESLFNDGTGVVMFQVMLALVIASLTGESSSIGTVLISGMAMFLQMVIIGGVVGGALAYGSNLALRWTENHLLEVTISVALAFGSFFVAEQFHGSGVIGVVVAGMVLGNAGKHEEMTPQARVALDHFWEMIAFLINSILFLLIGFEIINRVSLTGNTLTLAVVAIASTLIARLLVYPASWFVTQYSADSNIPKPWRHVLFWGGLRGSVPLALMLILLDLWIAHPEAGLVDDAALLTTVYDEILVMAFAVVLWTLIVQGLTIKPLMNKLGVGDSADGLSHQFEHEIAELIQCSAAIEEMVRLEELGVSDKEHLAISRASFEERHEKAQDNLKNILNDDAFQTRLDGRLEARLMAIQQEALSRAERSGLLSGHIGEGLRWKLDTELTLLLDKEELKGEVPLPKA
jgi:CPA1 family monovalent cation:H+ antiporter